VAGKGHEATQEIQGRKRPFSDREHVRLTLGARGCRHEPPTDDDSAASRWLDCRRKYFGDATRSFSRVHTDSRTVEPGDLFVALKGERFDAHDFLADVVARGAAAVLVSRKADVGVPALIVPDTRTGLGQLAAGWRRRSRRRRWP
jgi:UDP-N-acetylmuramyl tripeptide synthase